MKKVVLVFGTMLLLNACVDLSGSRSTYMKQEALQQQVQAHKDTLYDGEVHTMRGGLGIFSIGMNTLRDSVAKQYHIPAYSTMWYHAGGVTRFIIASYRQHPRPIILVGHSLGANEQIKVARNLNKVGIPVALLVTVDAVSQTIVPPNVQQALNIYKPGFVPMFSGLKLRAVNPQKTHIDNVNVATLNDVHVNHFTVDKDAVVQAMIMERIKKVITNGKKHKI